MFMFSLKSFRVYSDFSPDNSKESLTEFVIFATLQIVTLEIKWYYLGF